MFEELEEYIKGQIEYYEDYFKLEPTEMIETKLNTYKDLKEKIDTIKDGDK